MGVIGIAFDRICKELLDATLKLISEKGYLGSTTREIAQEAGVTELTLFRHFGTKEKLFEALLRHRPSGPLQSECGQAHALLQASGFGRRLHCRRRMRHSVSHPSTSRLSPL